jgi:S-adenosylmethionine hydrolase
VPSSITRLIGLVSDFGPGSPYVGQVLSVLSALAPGISVVDLMSDAPPWRPDLAAYLLPALMRDLPGPAVLVCVIDPGVGTERRALAIEVDGHWLVGPDNGLLSVAARKAHRVRALRVDWRPERLSESFHGRDLFAPVGARLAMGRDVDCTPISSSKLVGDDWPDQSASVIYVDGYGNLVTGLEAASVPRESIFELAGRALAYSRVFSEAPADRPFWYENCFGLVEVAWAQGRAADLLCVKAGDRLSLVG